MPSNVSLSVYGEAEEEEEENDRPFIRNSSVVMTD